MKNYVLTLYVHYQNFLYSLIFKPLIEIRIKKRLSYENINIIKRNIKIIFDGKCLKQIYYYANVQHNILVDKAINHKGMSVVND